MRNMIVAVFIGASLASPFIWADAINEAPSEIASAAVEAPTNNETCKSIASVASTVLFGLLAFAAGNTDPYAYQDPHAASDGTSAVASLACD